ncbi:MAG: lamin tail domain-containing protein [Candidatus Aenigmarchaeota archaeon]|nr:lamin tail domain-containing protein [Candidatus Aenigmarchaeota archaeon]
MRGIPLLVLVSCVLITSGCVSETGDVAVEFTGLEFSADDNMTEPVNESLGEEPSEEVNESIGDDELSEDGNETLQENITHDPCAGKLCDDSITTCPDGEVVSCENICSNRSGLCSSCIPDCSEHQLPKETCDIECGDCEVFDEEDCSSSILFYCSGNGICEPNYNGGGEWPDSPDCVGFGGCDDNDDCTQDVFDPNIQQCIHVDICCDDGDDCTLDEYDADTGLCEHTYICCGNGECEPENNETEENCPEDCFEEGEESGEVEILDIDPAGNETVTLSGSSVDLTNWTIEDEGSHVYTFPDGFVIDEIVYIHTVGCPADNNDTDLYWGIGDGTCRTAEIWNPHDTATLRNQSGDVVDTFTY